MTSRAGSISSGGAISQHRQAGAALSHATLYRRNRPTLSGNRVSESRLDQAGALFNPLQVVTINALADLPVLEYRECAFAKMVTNLRGDLASEL